jgi:uncharacterized protein
MQFKKMLSILFLCGMVCSAGIALVSYKVLRSSCYQCGSIYSAQYLHKKRAWLMETYNAQPVHFMTEDNLRLSGLFIVNPDAQYTMLLCHGYRSAKEAMYKAVTLCPKANILLFDFRSHGESQGDMISIGHYEQKDIAAAVQFLRHNEQTKQLPLIGFGFSMGAASLIGAAARGVVFDGLILDSSFARLDAQLARVFQRKTGLPTFPFMPVAQWMFEYIAHYRVDQVSPADMIAHISCPLLIVHSHDDDFTPVYNAHELYEKATVPHKELWLVSHSQHGKIVKEHGTQYGKRIDDFLCRYVQSCTAEQSTII